MNIDLTILAECSIALMKAAETNPIGAAYMMAAAALWMYWSKKE